MLIRDFKKSYKENGRHDLKSQVLYLSRLANIYVSRSESSSLKWVELLKVRNLILNRGSCILLVERDLKDDFKH